MFLLRKAVGIYAKKPFKESIPIQGKFSMALLIQKEGVIILGGPSPKELVLEMLKVEGKNIEDFSFRLTT